MTQHSSPAQLAQFRTFHADFWRHYLVGQEGMDPDMLRQAPFDYWRLVYNVGDPSHLASVVQTAIEARPNGAGNLLWDLENLFSIEWHGMDNSALLSVFPGSFFNKKIAPALSQEQKMPAMLGYIRLNEFLRTLFSLEQHLADSYITPWCFRVVKSDVYCAALQRVGAFVSQQPTTV